MSQITSINIPVKLTANAIEEIKRIYIKDTIETSNKFLRIGVKGGGCSGMTYVLEFDIEQTGDIHYEIDGVDVILNQSHELYLADMEIDFGNGLNDRGFVFKNPNASSTCGCGTSFAV
jgi:iron-sulfur cluster assembly protein